MEFEEATARQQTLVSAVVALVLQVFRPFLLGLLTDEGWEQLLRVIYPEVERARRESAELGRAVYDTQREQALPDRPRHDTYLPEYRFEWFVEDMEPARQAMMDEDSSESAADIVALRAARAVEGGWRRSLLQAVDSDPARPGWARVATGRETCGFCLMLVSRGPVYTSARAAGFGGSERNAIEAARQAESGDASFMDAHMREWHTGCDCRVVPVFDENNWTGREAYLRAEALWREATRGHSGRDAMNAFRRAVENGEEDFDFNQFATAA